MNRIDRGEPNLSPSFAQPIDKARTPTRAEPSPTPVLLLEGYRRLAKVRPIILAQPPAPPERLRPEWLGNASVLIARGPSAWARPAADGFIFGSWARRRAQVTRVSFEVWAPGLTDRDNPDLWKQLDVEVHYRFAGEDGFRRTYVGEDARSGNNALYALDLRRIDPWANAPLDPWASASGMWAHEPRAPVTVSASGARQAHLEYYFTANGEELRAEGKRNFRGVFESG
jgi:hypothetical protein